MLQGTEYEKDAARIAREITTKGYNNELALHDLPQLGKIGGYQTFGIMQALLEALDTPDLKVSPAAKTLADNNGVNLSELEGSGKDGLILKSDVEDFLASED